VRTGAHLKVLADYEKRNVVRPAELCLSGVVRAARIIGALRAKNAAFEPSTDLRQSLVYARIPLGHTPVFAQKISDT